MPYIKPDKRTVLAPLVRQLVRNIQTPGELTYVLYALMKSTTEKMNVDYSILSSIMGCMECAKTEFYRRIVAPYEDQKIKENGDV